MIPSQALAEVIQATAEAEGYSVFTNHMPDQPDKAVLVYDSNLGRLEARKMASGEREEHPLVRVIVRGKDSSARTLAALIADLADSTHNFVLSDGQILRVITKSNTIGFAGQEPQTRRYLYTQSFRMTLE